MTDEIVRLPASTASTPQVRKKVPEPFQRPSIAITGGVQARRQWDTIPACDIEEGDIIPGIGRITHVEEHISAPDLDHVLSMPQHGVTYHTDWTITVTGGLGTQRTYQGNDLVYAFSQEPG